MLSFFLCSKRSNLTPLQPFLFVRISSSIFKNLRLSLLMKPPSEPLLVPPLSEKSPNTPKKPSTNKNRPEIGKRPFRTRPASGFQPRRNLARAGDATWGSHPPLILSLILSNAENRGKGGRTPLNSALSSAGSCGGLFLHTGSELYSARLAGLGMGWRDYSIMKIQYQIFTLTLL